MKIKIYKIKNLLNGKIYIGQTQQDLEKYWGSGLAISSSIRKYGKINFTKEIICVCNSKKEANEKEIFYIKKFNSMDSKIGYNLTQGGEGGLELGLYANKIYMENSTSEQRSERSRKANKSLTPEQKKIKLKKLVAGAKKYWKTLNVEEKSLRGKKARRNSKGAGDYWKNMTPEQRSERGRKMNELRWKGNLV